MSCGELGKGAKTGEEVKQDWKCMDGATAWHLIDRHAEDWSDVGRMMQEWLDANSATDERDELRLALAHVGAKDEQMERDAERYRWLRTNAIDCQDTNGLEFVKWIPCHTSPNHADIDKAIDDCMVAA